jgi:hypothetical protein
MRNASSTRNTLSRGAISRQFEHEFTSADPAMNVTEFGLAIRFKGDHANADS